MDEKVAATIENVKPSTGDVEEVLVEGRQYAGPISITDVVDLVMLIDELEASIPNDLKMLDNAWGDNEFAQDNGHLVNALIQVGVFNGDPIVALNYIDKNSNNNLVLNMYFHNATGRLRSVARSGMLKSVRKQLQGRAIKAVSLNGAMSPQKAVETTVRNIIYDNARIGKAEAEVIKFLEDAASAAEKFY